MPCNFGRHPDILLPVLQSLACSFLFSPFFSVSAGSTLFGAVSTCVHCASAIALTWTSRTSRGKRRGLIGLTGFGPPTWRWYAACPVDLWPVGRWQDQWSPPRLHLQSRCHNKEAWKILKWHWSHKSWAKRCCPKKADFPEPIYTLWSLPQMTRQRLETTMNMTDGITVLVVAPHWYCAGSTWNNF